MSWVIVVTGALNGMCMCVDRLGLLLYSTGPPAAVKVR